MFQRTSVLLCRVERFAQTRTITNNVGFIGLGNMGSHMANHLAKQGRKLKVFDVVADAAKSVPGAIVCKTPQEAATDVSVVFTMLPDGNVVKDTVLRNEGIAKGIKKDALMIDCSTIEPTTAKELHTIAKDNGYRFIDCPVSGGVTGAAAGTLTYMIGGDIKDVDTARQYLLQAGKNIFHCGGPGAGQVAKLCNNLILGVTMAGTAESMNMGLKYGLDPKVLTDIINVSTGRSWSSETYNPHPGILPNVPSSKNYDGGFMVKLIAKDLGLAEGAALAANAPVPMTAAVHQLYRAMMNHGLGDKDFSVIYQFLQGKKF
ncbi:PREDICTED: NAD-dependent L-serine dehydrogenase [Nicrophorus vespilloides]|uniref:3-hydroxyisobutyrate dehydrogenase n=1 Tax=Nicrophorus vespilloides TaxID=110193 RepID=A0ABM1MNZ5_NICVS|nr:PREDICTED: NAD-dependent L-serine dehydrogenase [Nicrophorus vespilloides]